MIRQRPLLKYLLTTIDNGYVTKLKIRSADENSINILLKVKSKERVNVIYGMIEANLHTNKSLGADSYTFSKSGAVVHTSDNMTYYISVG